MNTFLVLTFLFAAGSLIGWCIEVIWRRFFSRANPERKWINPGFLIGPYLPLYGFCLTLLFLLTNIDVSFISNPYAEKAVLFCFMALSITLFEYIAGLIFIKGMKIALWDYSNQWGNIQGIICPLYTVFWYILSAAYYFLIHPKILNWLYWFTNHLSFAFFVGFFYGILIIDFFYNLNVINKVVAFAKENKIVIKLDHLHAHIQEINRENKQKVHFWLSMKSEQTAMLENLKNFAKKHELLHKQG